MFICVYVANGDGTVSVIDGPVSAPLAITTAALPAGLTLNQSTGVISGTPVVSGTADFTIQVTDTASPAKTAARPLSITTGDCARTVTGTRHGP